ncbi:hypothetical protein D3C76_1504290 [compost metagenome]
MQAQYIRVGSLGTDQRLQRPQHQQPPLVDPVTQTCPRRGVETVLAVQIVFQQPDRMRGQQVGNLPLVLLRHQPPRGHAKA